MTSANDQASPLLAEHQSLGAQFTDFAGWQMPLRYTSELAEHRAVRSTAGLFDLSHMGEILIQGTDAGAMLDHALAGQLSSVAVGRAKYSLLCTEAGGVIDDLVVYRLATDRFLVVANAANVLVVHSELAQRTTGFAAAARDHSSDVALLAVQGPLAQQIIFAATAPEHRALVESMRYYSAARTVVADVEVLLARTGYTGEDGFELYVRPADASRLWRAMLRETTAVGGAPAGLACRDTLRLEAGMALYGHELTLETNPYEAGLGRVVKLGKDFVGRVALARLSQQPLTRQLIGIEGTGRRSARPGYTLYDAVGNAPVGTITSGCLSPTLGHQIALAYIDPRLSEPGTAITVDVRGTKESFTVTTTPFYRRS